MKTVFSESEKDTFNIALEYGKTLKSGDVILLHGDFGAGKTAFTKGIAKALNINEEVTSPTYSYLNVYGGKLFHYDFYRLSSGEEAEALGLNDYFEGDNICIIEWGENVEEILPETAKNVTIEKLGENKRKITL